jgi:hypothetical protein
MQLQGSRSSSHFTLFSRESLTQQVVFALSTAALRFNDLHWDSQLQVQGRKLLFFFALSAAALRFAELTKCNTKAASRLRALHAAALRFNVVCSLYTAALQFNERQSRRRSELYLRSPQLQYASTQQVVFCALHSCTTLRRANQVQQSLEKAPCKLPSIPGLVVLVYSVRNQIQVGFMTAKLAPPLSFNSTSPS